MPFDDAAIDDVFERLVSWAMGTGRFDFVNQHEPTNAPMKGIQCSFWIQSIKPYKLSGMGTMTGVVLFNGRIYKSFKSLPYDNIDPEVTSAVADLMNTLTSDFNFGGEADVRAIDLLGMAGPGLSAQAGYLEIDRQIFRVMTVSIPVIIDDMFIVSQGTLWDT